MAVKSGEYFLARQPLLLTQGKTTTLCTEWEAFWEVCKHSAPSGRPRLCLLVPEALHFGYLETPPPGTILNPLPNLCCSPQGGSHAVSFLHKRSEPLFDTSYASEISLPPASQEKQKDLTKGPSASFWHPKLTSESFFSTCEQVRAFASPNHPPAHHRPPSLHFPRVWHLGSSRRATPREVGLEGTPDNPRGSRPVPGAQVARVLCKVAVLIAGRHEPPPVPTYLTCHQVSRYN